MAARTITTRMALEITILMVLAITIIAMAPGTTGAVVGYVGSDARVFGT
jgi:hypothetical protein